MVRLASELFLIDVLALSQSMFRSDLLFPKKQFHWCTTWNLHMFSQ
jgi:hypothetical protein